MPTAYGTDVGTPCQAYRDMQTRWYLIRALCGGTIGMRADGEAWTPRRDREDPSTWRTRVNASFLYNAFADTVDVLSSKPFTRPVSIRPSEDDLPEALQPLLVDADREGTSLSDFACELFTDGLKYGMALLMPDYPQVPKEKNEQQVLDQDLRPYFTRICPENLIAWQTEIDTSGRERLIQIRIREVRYEAMGDWGETRVDYVRVWEEDAWYLYRKTVSPAGTAGTEVSWDEVATGENKLGRIALIPVYFDRTGFLTSDPPLEDLAWTNLAHWQSSSHQRTALDFARIPVIWGAGWPEKTCEEGIVVASNKAILTPNPSATLTHLSGGVEPINAGRQDLLDLEAQMIVLGAQPLIMRSGATATAERRDESRATCRMQAWVRSLEAGLKTAFQTAAELIDEELDENFSVDVFSDFAISARTGEDLAFLLSARQSGQIDHGTFLSEVKRRGVLSELVSTESVKEELAKEGPALGTMGLDPKTGQPLKAQEFELDEDGEPVLDEDGNPIPVDSAQAGADGQQPIAGGGDIKVGIVTGALEIVMSVAKGEIPRSSGVNLLALVMSISPAEADRIIGEAGTGSETQPNVNPLDEAARAADVAKAQALASSRPPPFGGQAQPGKVPPGKQPAPGPTPPPLPAPKGKGKKAKPEPPFPPKGKGGRAA